MFKSDSLTPFLLDLLVVELNIENNIFNYHYHLVFLLFLRILNIMDRCLSRDDISLDVLFLI